MKSKVIIFGITILLLLFATMGCVTDPAKEKIDNENNKLQKYEYTEQGILKPELAQDIIALTAEELILALSHKDTEKIAGFVHPFKGVRFTPYTYVSVEQDLVCTPEEMKNFFQDRKDYLWGFYDGTGDEIRLTPSAYYEKFIYSQDFINAHAIGYNEVLSSGNMPENQFEVYEQLIVVEYYFSGFNPEYAGLDWQSLRLVFEEYNKEWKLVGIIHNQWTI
ncbi:MAG: hypothetical protein GX248_05915 [Peptococcaceae bacterium]|jgi:hypothetical protein|nr:hypothetical protein [Peptococcaceae bacterium]